MGANVMPCFSLSVEAKAVIWRIFGKGESPLTGRSTYELIEPIVRRRVSPIEQGPAIAEIRQWFESQAEQRWLKKDMHEPVAALILEGIGADRSKTAAWAVGSIDADLAATTIQFRWTPEEINSFVAAALATLEDICSRDEVLDATRCAGFAGPDSVNAKIPISAVRRKGRLETFRYLNNHGFELVHRGLHPGAGNLVELIVKLQPERFESLIERLDHPVIQARATRRMIAETLPLDHRKTLQWITEGSCDALVALAIENTLDTVNRLDMDLRSANRSDADEYMWSTELRTPGDDLDSAAAGLLTDLVEQLAALDPLACARWIGELLREAPYVLRPRGAGEKSRRIEQLEKRCTVLLARLVRQSWSKRLVAVLRAGLCLTPLPTWTRHMAEVAWEIRDVEPARAAEIARMALHEHERHIANQLERNHLFLDWTDWRHREWLHGLGVCLALSGEEINLPGWVLARCQALPLSVWDAEENYEAFSTANRIAQHWFLVSLLAISPLKELGRMIDPAAVRALAETLWAHCRFSGKYLHSHPEASVVAEHAARFAVEFGEPSDAWLLEQARNSGVGPCATWALIDQRKLKRAREGGTDANYDEMIATEIVSIASDRFGDGSQFDLEALRFWGLLWLLLGGINGAEQTAMAILAFPMRMHDRAHKIVVLKLLALVASRRKLAPTIADYPALLHGQLWPGYTPSEEHTDRQQIGELFERSEFHTL